MNASTVVSDSEDIAAENSTGADVSYIAEGIWTGGDLPSHLGDAAMLADLAGIQAAGITHILDNQIECAAFQDHQVPIGDCSWSVAPNFQLEGHFGWSVFGRRGTVSGGL